MTGPPLDGGGEQVIVRVVVRPSFAGPKVELFDLGDGLSERPLRDAILERQALAEQHVIGFGDAADVSARRKTNAEVASTVTAASNASHHHPAC